MTSIHLLMTEREFLASYDPSAFDPLAVAVDVVVFTTVGAELQVLLIERAEPPSRGKLSLPGSFVGRHEDLDAAAGRALRQKAGVEAAVRQFGAFGTVDRDPRMRIISIGYMALLAHEQLRPLLSDSRVLMPVVDGVVRSRNGHARALPFDHADIIAAAVRSLRVDLDHSPWSFGLLAAEFSLRELQLVHEAVRGRALNKPAFRKRLAESGRIVATGRMESGKGFRPAELYRVTEVGDDD